MESQLDELADGLIKARIAAGLSQRALIQRLGVKEQQIQCTRLNATPSQAINANIGDQSQECSEKSLCNSCTAPPPTTSATKAPAATFSYLVNLIAVPIVSRHRGLDRPVLLWTPSLGWPSPV